MALCNAKRDKIAARRERVQALRSQGKTERAIAAELGVDCMTVHHDCQANLQQWREFAAQSVEEHRARLLAELENVRERAFACERVDAPQLQVVLGAIDRCAKLLGTDAPQRIDVEVRRLTDEQLQERARILSLRVRGSLGGDGGAALDSPVTDIIAISDGVDVPDDGGMDAG